MTDGRCGPQVVHGPHHGLAALHDLFYVTQRQHALVYPRQVNEVGLAKLGQRRYVGSRVGDIDSKEIVLGEMKMTEDGEPFPEEPPPLEPLVRQPHHRQLVGGFVYHQHLSLHAVVLQSLHQSVGSNSCSTCALACVDN